MERAMDRRANVALELAFPAAIQELAMLAKSHGYKTELHIIATDRRESWTAVLDRFDRAAKAGDEEARIVGRKSMRMPIRAGLVQSSIPRTAVILIVLTSRGGMARSSMTITSLRGMAAKNGKSPHVPSKSS
jgi:hypothetical protein